LPSHPSLPGGRLLGELPLEPLEHVLLGGRALAACCPLLVALPVDGPYAVLAPGLAAVLGARLSRLWVAVFPLPRG